MKFEKHFLDDIRSRLLLSDVVSRYVNLSKRGKEWVGLSPFNPEKTPSFFVNDQKKFYYCFSSGRHGDVFRFVMEKEMVSFSEAVIKLAQMAGVVLPESRVCSSETVQIRDYLSKVMEMTAAFYERCYQYATGKTAKKYVRERGIQCDTRGEFRIGYAPNDRYALRDFLRKQGVDDKTMLDVGLLSASEDYGSIYDRFRNRIMFPIENESSQIIGFGGRSLCNKMQPKYLNSPESYIFQKRQVLFNASRARGAVNNTDERLVVVEGYFDAIIAYQAGIKSVVSVMGSTITEEQILALWRIDKEPVICFDGDSAGLRAASRIVDRALPLLRGGCSFRFAFLPDNSDPDTFIFSFGVDRFRSAIQRSMSLFDVLWDREISCETLDTPERRVAVEQRLGHLVSNINDKLVQRAYKVKFRTGLSKLFWHIDSKRKDNLVAGELIRTPASQEAELLGIERIILGLLIEYPNLLEHEVERLARINFEANGHDLLKQELEKLIGTKKKRQDLLVDIHDKLIPQFYSLLEQIYGMPEINENSKVNVQNGHRLRKNFPILNFRPPEDYVVMCFSHFLDKVELVKMEQELRSEIISLENNENERTAMRIMELSSEIKRFKVLYHRQENNLAEEAKAIKADCVGKSIFIM